MNYNIHRADGNGQRSGTKVKKISGLNSESIHTAFDKLHKNTNLFGLPLYCRKIKNFTPPKVLEKKDKNVVDGDPPNTDGKESSGWNARHSSLMNATPERIGGNHKQKSKTDFTSFTPVEKDFASYTPVEKKEYFFKEENEMDNKAVEVSERYGNLTLNNPKSLEFGSDESEEDINNDPEGEKKDASDSSQKNLKKNKTCVLVESPWTMGD